jgi:hypothetical protein
VDIDGRILSMVDYKWRFMDKLHFLQQAKANEIPYFYE